MAGSISFRPASVSPPVSSPSASPRIQSSSQATTPVTATPTISGGRAPTLKVSQSLDLGSEAAEVNAAIVRSRPEEIQARSSHLEQLGLVPAGFSKIKPEALQMARQNLRPVSQHQVLHLSEAFDSDSRRATVVESGRSVKLRQAGSPFGVGMPLRPGGVLDIVGHGSPDGRTVGGKTPRQLAEQINSSGVTHLASIHLKSCHSEAFAQALSAEIDQLNQSGAGLRVDKITGASGNIAIDRATGQSFSEVQLAQSPTSIEHDGLLGYSPEQLLERGFVSKVVTDGPVTILPFINRSSSAATPVSDLVIEQVGNTVGVALNQTLQEITDGTLLGNLAHADNVARFASGHLASAIEHCKVSDSGNPKYDSTLIANVGYLIEDRVTQILLEKHGLSPANFQCTLGKSRPDIAIAGGKILIDLTASASGGHILGKDPAVWGAPGVQSLEVTYPSFNLEGAKAVIKSQVVDLSAIEAAQRQASLQNKAFSDGIKGLVKSQIDAVTLADPTHYKADLNIHNKGKAFEYVADKLDLTKAELTHVLNFYRPTDVAFLQSSSSASRDLSQATRGLDKLFARIDTTANADISELFEDFKSRRKALPEELVAADEVEDTAEDTEMKK